jgi:hypothetical protein
MMRCTSIYQSVLFLLPVFLIWGCGSTQGSVVRINQQHSHSCAATVEKAPRPTVEEREKTISDGQKVYMFRIESQGGKVVLQRKVESQKQALSTNGWVDVCKVPCHPYLNLNDTFRTAGEGYAESEPFQLTLNKQIIRAYPGAKEETRLGRNLVIVGSSFSAISGGLLGWGLWAKKHDQPSTSQATLILSGTLFIMFGVPLVVLGVMSIQSSSRTRIEQKTWEEAHGHEQPGFVRLGKGVWFGPSGILF